MTASSPPGAPLPVAAADPGAAPLPCGSRRRRLWDLSEAARELVLGLSLPAESLRRELEKGLGRVHRRPCVLVGPETLLLSSALKDLGSRNPLSERLHRHLEAQHALAVAKSSSLREVQALEAYWQTALEDPDAVSIVSRVWAVLTHPRGVGLESRVSSDARAWVWRRTHDAARVREQQLAARAALRQAEEDSRALHERLARAQQALDAERIARQRLQIELDALKALTSGLNGSPAGGPDAVAGARPILVKEGASEQRGIESATAIGGRSTENAARPAAARDLFGELADRSAWPTPSVESHASHSPVGRTTPSARPAAELADVRDPLPTADRIGAPSLDGRDVLCVGGIRRAVARYRAVVERAGGRFEHHDGGIEDGVSRLGSVLARADVVVCQAGCLNHEAYHRIKRHCRATGTPCVYLERPSVAAFGKALGALHLARREAVAAG